MTRERSSRRSGGGDRHIGVFRRNSRSSSGTTRASSAVSCHTLPRYTAMTADNAANPHTLPSNRQQTSSFVSSTSQSVVPSTTDITTESLPTTATIDHEPNQLTTHSSPSNHNAESSRAHSLTVESVLQSNHETEVNANPCNGDISVDDSQLNVSAVSNTSTTPILDPLTGYTITELARPAVDPSVRQDQMLMMDNSVVSGYQSGGVHDRVSQARYPVPDHILSEMLTCMPTEYTPTRPRTGRRHRQRRRRRRRRRSRHHGHRRAGRHRDDSTYVKPPCCSILGCKICLASCLQFKKVLVFFAAFGFICVLIGIVLGVLRAPGNNFFTLSLMFVGLGLILLTMVLIGWKCTPTDHEPCHMLFGLGSFCSLTRRHRRRRDRLYWLGNGLYPEFRRRVPPPSYAAAMQDQRSELRDLELMPYTPGSPPPSYKSHTTIERPGIHIIFPRNDEFPSSNPPTYRLRSQSVRPSLAILNDSNISTEAESTPPIRYSVSSTTALVEAEQHIHVHSPPATGGIVNMSFDSSEHTVDMSGQDQELNFYSSDSFNNRPSTTRPQTTDGAVQTEEVFQGGLSRSVAIVLEDENASTL